MSKQDRDPMIDKAIELYALYGTPASVFREMREEYGDACLTASVIKRIREKHRPEILKLRNKLSAKIPILNVYERWGYLQTILDGSLEGEVIYDARSGLPVEAKIDRNIALSVIKTANDMTKTQGVVNNEDDDLIKSIVIEAFEERKREQPKMTDEEVLNEILDKLGQKVAPYVSEIKEELVLIENR